MLRGWGLVGSLGSPADRIVQRLGDLFLALPTASGGAPPSLSLWRTARDRLCDHVRIALEDCPVSQIVYAPPAAEDASASAAARRRRPRPLARGWTRGNVVDVLTDGRDAFARKCAAVAAASRLAWWSSYELADDGAGRACVAAFARERPRPPASAVLMFDAWGAEIGLRAALLRPLDARGVAQVPFNHIRWRFRRWSVRRILNRNHQKIVVADDVAFCGGRNVGDGYAGGKNRFGFAYRDVDLAVRGPAALQLAHVFYRALLANPLRIPPVEQDARASLRLEIAEFLSARGAVEAAGVTSGAGPAANAEAEAEAERKKKKKPQTSFSETAAAALSPAAISDVFVRVLHQSSEFVDTNRASAAETLAPWSQRSIFWWLLWRKVVARPLPSISNELIDVIGRARISCVFTSPYFLPPRRIARALLAAAERGVEVRVVVAGTTDLVVHQRASRHGYGRFLRGGVRVFEYFGLEVMHAKVALVDQVYCAVGSFNLDHWSRHNLEAAVAVVDRRVADRVDQELEAIRAQSVEVREEDYVRRSLWTRLLDAACYFVHEGLLHPGVSFVPYWISDVYDDTVEIHRHVDPEYFRDEYVAARSSSSSSSPSSFDRKTRRSGRLDLDEEDEDEDDGDEESSTGDRLIDLR